MISGRMVGLGPSLEGAMYAISCLCVGGNVFGFPSCSWVSLQHLYRVLNSTLWTANANTYRVNTAARPV